jgi:diketogulonate reductase-like aldo/keto reductase
VLPKSVNPERIKANFDVFSWSIPEDLQAKLSTLDNQVRLLAGAAHLHVMMLHLC